MRSKVSDTNDISRVTQISGLDIAKRKIWRIIELEHFERLEIFVHFARGEMKRSNKEIYKSSGYNNYEARQADFAGQKEDLRGSGYRKFMEREKEETRCESAAANCRDTRMTVRIYNLL